MFSAPEQCMQQRNLNEAVSNDCASVLESDSYLNVAEVLCEVGLVLVR